MIEVFGSQFRVNAPNDPRRGELRKLTVTDLFALTAGFAIGLVLPPFVNVTGAWFLIGNFPIWFFIVLGALRLILWLNLAITCVIFARRFQFGGMPRPSEWLAILLTLHLVQHMLPTLDDVVNDLIQITRLSWDFATWRWMLAGTGSLIVATGVIFLPVCQRRFPSWLSLIVLSAIIFVLLWGPLRVFALQFPYMFPTRLADDGWTLWLTIATLHGLGTLPYAVLIGMPTVATYYTWRRGGWRNWTWVQWVAAGIATVIGLVWFLVYYFGSYESPPTGWISERIVTSVGLVLTWLLCARLLRHSSVRSSVTP